MVRERTLLSREPLCPIKVEAELTSEPTIVLGITGASGAPIAVSALKALRKAGARTALVVSRGAEAVLQEECGVTPEALRAWADQVYRDDDLAAPIASGSNPTKGMAIVPCSSNTLAKIAVGVGDTLITRAAQVHLKERRTLVLVPRETPLSPILLGHMTRLAELGVVMLVAAPPYYTHPKSVEEMVDYLAGKVLDHLRVPHQLYRGWKADVA